VAAALQTSQACLVVFMTRTTVKTQLVRTSRRVANTAVAADFTGRKQEVVCSSQHACLIYVHQILYMD
jgi:hypothetical protein